MATPLLNVLKENQKCSHSLHNVCRRYFASKSRKSPKDEQNKKVHVKALFDAQRVHDKATATAASRAGPWRTYRAMMDKRRDQADRSVLVRVPVSPQDVCDSLMTVGPIRQAFCLQGVKNYLLVEFQQRETVERLMRHVTYFPDLGQVPVRSRLLYAMNMHVQRHKPGRSEVVVSEVATAANREELLSVEDYVAAESVSAQIMALHDARRLSDAGTRLRFFICSLVEDLVRTSMPCCRIEPFGSSSNGFGWEGCDVDMMMDLRPPASHVNSGGRFRFLTKRGSEEGRVFGQQCLDVVGEMVRGLMPSAHSVNKVLNARVPILKFHHQATSLDCDLCSFNVSGGKMSELMYLLGEVDPRVRPLMTTLKQWARSCDLSRGHPGPWPASFTLLSMLVFFLQRCSPPVLPSLRRLQQLAGPDDHFIIDDVDYAFVTDLSKVDKSTNTQSLDELLKEFFHFFAHFDFSSQGLSLIEGGPFPRPTTHTPTHTPPMHIENPLSLDHNISTNVSAPYVARMQEAMVEAVRCLESKSVPDGAQPWGLLCLFQPSLSQTSVSKAYSVAGLFQEEGEKREEEDGERSDGGGGVDEEDSESLLVVSSKDVAGGSLRGGAQKGSAVS